MIKLGDKVKDKVTGFTGVATAKVEYLNGCIQFYITPKMKGKENKMPDGAYIDQQQLEVIGKKVKVEKKETGGAMSNTPPASYGC